MDGLRHDTHTNKSCLGAQRGAHLHVGPERDWLRGPLGSEASRTNVWPQEQDVQEQKLSFHMLQQSLTTR